MDLQLDGRVALITGATRGIGYAIAQRLVTQGADVVITARSEEDLDAAVKRLGGPDRARGIVADQLDRSGIDAMVAAAAQWRDGLHIVVNNAGPRMQSGAVAETDDEPWMAIFDTKAMGSIRVARAALPLLPDDGTGRIINITGVTTKTMIPNAGISGITNAAITALTRYLAAEAAPRNILVNAVCPGMTLTEGWHERAEAGAASQGITPDEFFAGMTQRLGIVLNRWADPAEIANVVGFVASDLASYMTGQMLVVDGGMGVRAILG